jgi:SHS2 domain-containing protein
MIFRFDAGGDLFRRFDLTSLSSTTVAGIGHGERFDPSRHPHGTMVKAATRHKLTFGRRGNLWVATVVLDL